jgi:hypothetical protein
VKNTFFEAKINTLRTVQCIGEEKIKLKMLFLPSNVNFLPILSPCINREGERVHGESQSSVNIQRVLHFISLVARKSQLMVGVGKNERLAL